MKSQRNSSSSSSSKSNKNHRFSTRKSENKKVPSLEMYKPLLSSPSSSPSSPSSSSSSSSSTSSTCLVCPFLSFSLSLTLFHSLTLSHLYPLRWLSSGASTPLFSLVVVMSFRFSFVLFLFRFLFLYLFFLPHHLHTLISHSSPKMY